MHHELFPTRPNRLHTHTHPPKRLPHPRSPMPPLSTLAARATRARPLLPAAFTGFCAIWFRVGSSSSSNALSSRSPFVALTQTQALVEFYESLVANEVYAARVTEGQTGVSSSYQNEEEYDFAGDVIEAGFVVVMVRG